MLRKTFTLPLLFICIVSVAQNADYLSYIDKYKDIAISEMERAGIPASIKLSQAILESNAGRSYLAKEGNNHFGIKCASDWNGRKIYREDDDYDHNGNLTKSCFRSYKSVEESFMAHSEFLRDPRKESRYGFLFHLDPLDYKRWAHGLKKAGYATSRNYPDQLIYLIESYELYRFDRMTSNDLLAGGGKAHTVLAGNVLINNDVKMVLAKAGETPAIIAQKTDTRLQDILKWNEGLTNPSQILDEKTRVYIQPKRRSYREKQQYHYVKEGETLYDISQLYGVRLECLYSRNRLPEGSQPAIDEKIKLRGWKVKRNEVPRLKSEVPPPSPPPAIIVPGEDNKLEMEEDTDTTEFLPPVSSSYTPAEKDFTSDFPTAPESVPEPNVTSPQPSAGAPTPATPPASQPEVQQAQAFHLVEKGDTLYNISRRYSLTVEELKQLNGINDNTIHLGQKLIVRK